MTPGKQLSEVRVLFMGRECFEALSEHDCQQIYDIHQDDIIERANRILWSCCWNMLNIFYSSRTLTTSLRKMCAR